MVIITLNLHTLKLTESFFPNSLYDIKWEKSAVLCLAKSKDFHCIWGSFKVEICNTEILLNLCCFKCCYSI